MRDLAQISHSIWLKTTSWLHTKINGHGKSADIQRKDLLRVARKMLLCTVQIHLSLLLQVAGTILFGRRTFNEVLRSFSVHWRGCALNRRTAQGSKRLPGRSWWRQRGREL